jgi:hypothetical protein
MGAPGLAFETWDPSNQFLLETPTRLFVIKERSRGICGAPGPQTKAPMSEFADLSRALCSSLAFTGDDKPLDRVSVDTDTLGCARDDKEEGGCFQ